MCWLKFTTLASHSSHTTTSSRVHGDDGAMLVCERCDKSYHTHCLTPPPPLDGALGSGWRCKNCRICRLCGVRSSGQWANHPFLCESCDMALPCPLCDLDTPQDHVICSCCYRPPRDSEPDHHETLNQTITRL
ncbi:Histone-lysine N-methyltransferase 2C [Liparis tanakae]|uniref:Histone-lysine N-methyltransferase 2C n=1 Tax=Liparis tanakae TaxID=230148 RepID=A0A4Z2F5J1_9TELE|nr:Histone-lysine N-methyltransferase 2C [Liparis tanakae]